MSHARLPPALLKLAVVCGAATAAVVLCRRLLAPRRPLRAVVRRAGAPERAAKAEPRVEVPWGVEV